MSLSQRLNKRVELWTVTAVRGGIGQMVEAPVRIDTVWAEVADKDGEVAVASDKVQRIVKTNITIRHRDLPDELSVHYKGSVYRVDAVLGQNNRTLLLATIRIGKVPPP